MNKSRGLLWTLFGLAFAITLAVVVGQRLSAQGMAVVIGVIAGVAASIPTSLIVVWFAARAQLSAAHNAAMRQAAEPVHYTAPAAPAPRQAEPAEPRIIVMAPPYQDQGGYPQRPQSINGYAQAAGYAQATAYPPQMMLPPRRFTVVGGAELAADSGGEPEEGSTWE
jgi:hypothetical protein